MTSVQAEPVSKEEAVAALRAAAFTIGEGYEGAGRTIVHTFVGGLGAEWDLDGAIQFIEAAEEVEWRAHIVGHDLAARNGDRSVRFDVRRPQAVQS